MATWGIELWDQRDVLERHTNAGIEYLDKCTNFMKERMRIEQQYAKSLHSLVKQYQCKKKEEENLQFSYQASFKAFLLENNDYASQREIIAEDIYNSILKEMQKLSLELKTQRKKTLHKLTELKCQIDVQHKSLLSAKKKYDQASEESDTALKNYQAAEQSLDQTKAQILKQERISQDKRSIANKVCADYRTTLQLFNEKQVNYYQTELPGIINKELQEMEENRIEKFSSFLKQYAEIQNKVNPIITKCLEGMITAGAKCNPSEDSLLLIEQHKSGEFPPGDVEFEEWTCGKPSGGNISLQKKHSKTSLWKKKDIISHENNIANDYSHLPPAQRKKKFNKAIAGLEEQLAQIEKAKSGAVKMREDSEKFGGNIQDIENQIDSYEKEMERIKPLLHQYQCYLAATIDAETARKDSRSSSVASPPRNSFEPVVISDVTSGQELPSTPAPTRPMRTPTPTSHDFSDEFHEAHCKVLYDFSGSNEGELSVSMGEELVVLDEDDGSGWTRVTRDGDHVEEGFIPTTYLQWM